MSISHGNGGVNAARVRQSCCGTFGGPSRLEIARARVASTERAALALLRTTANPFSLKAIADALRKADAELEAATVSDQLERSLDLMAAKGYVVEGFDRLTDEPDSWSVDAEPVTELAADGTIRGVGYGEAHVPMCRSQRLRHRLLPMARPLRDRTGGTQ
jgi:hypothetical protein